jgi:beta-glucosidase/6-phospho-beta-glucosidase/beta-galactosidase
MAPSEDLPSKRPRPALFPSFFMGGFECSTHIDRSHRRQDFVRLTQHDRFFRQDYERALSVGLRVVREGLRWHLIESGGPPGPHGSNGAARRYDFSSIAPMVDAAEEMGITLINCLHHYGLPDGADPLHPDFPKRFASYAAAFAEWRARRVSRPRWYGAVNETSLFSFAAGEEGWFYPFYTDSGQELKVAMVKAALAATDAIRAMDPQARFVTIDPMLHQVPPHSRPELAEQAERENRSQWDAWDMALGRQLPELGGGAGRPGRAPSWSPAPSGRRGSS